MGTQYRKALVFNNRQNKRTARLLGRFNTLNGGWENISPKEISVHDIVNLNSKFYQSELLQGLKDNGFFDALKSSKKRIGKGWVDYKCMWITRKRAAHMLLAMDEPKVRRPDTGGKTLVVPGLGALPLHKSFHGWLAQHDGKQFIVGPPALGSSG